jgi:hypothetical protein
MAMSRKPLSWWLVTILLTLAGVVVAVWLTVEYLWWGHDWGLWVLLGAAGVVSVGLLFDALGTGKRAPVERTKQ